MSEVLVEKTEGLPESEAVLKELLHGKPNRWDPFRDDYENMLVALEGIAPVQAYYVPTVTPHGVAPKHIRRGWVGLRLPVRSKRQTEEFGYGFTVLAREALEVLSIKRPQADSWWRNHFIEDVKCKTAEVKAKYEEEYEERAPDHIGYINAPENRFDEYLVNFDTFTFDPSKGLILPLTKYAGSLMAHDTLVASACTQQAAN